MQSRHKKVLDLCSGSQKQLCPGESERLGVQEEGGDEEWGKDTWAGQWGLGAPHTDPTRAIYTRLFTREAFQASCHHCRTFLPQGFFLGGGVTPQTRHGSFSQPLLSRCTTLSTLTPIYPFGKDALSNHNAKGNILQRGLWHLEIAEESLNRRPSSLDAWE